MDETGRPSVSPKAAARRIRTFQSSDTYAQSSLTRGSSGVASEDLDLILAPAAIRSGLGLGSITMASHAPLAWEDGIGGGTSSATTCSAACSKCSAAPQAVASSPVPRVSALPGPLGRVAVGERLAAAPVSLALGAAAAAVTATADRVTTGKTLGQQLSQWVGSFAPDGVSGSSRACGIGRSSTRRSSSAGPGAIDTSMALPPPPLVVRVRPRRSARSSPCAPQSSTATDLSTLPRSSATWAGALLPLPLDAAVVTGSGRGMEEGGDGLTGERIPNPSAFVREVRGKVQRSVEGIRDAWERAIAHSDQSDSTAAASSSPSNRSDGVTGGDALQAASMHRTSNRDVRCSRKERIVCSSGVCLAEAKSAEHCHPEAHGGAGGGVAAASAVQRPKAGGSKPEAPARGTGGVVEQLLCGAFAGVVSRTAIAPIDLVRTRLISSHAMEGAEKTAIGVLGSIFRKDGWKGLFRGNGINCLRVAPSKAIELCTFEMLKRTLCAPGHPLQHIAAPLSGGAAGLAGTIATYPLEVMRTRISVQPERYANLGSTFTSMVRNEGVGSLYRGLPISLFGVFPYAATNYFVYDTLRGAYRRATGSDKVPPVHTLLFGALAASVSSAVTFPLEVVRRRLQLGPVGPGISAPSGLAILQQICRQEGWRAVYRGLGTTWLKLIPAAGISFVCYEAARNALRVDDASFAAAAAADAAAEVAAAAAADSDAAAAAAAAGVEASTPANALGAAAVVENGALLSVGAMASSAAKGAAGEQESLAGSLEVPPLSLALDTGVAAAAAAAAAPRASGAAAAEPAVSDVEELLDLAPPEPNFATADMAVLPGLLEQQAVLRRA